MIKDRAWTFTKDQWEPEVWSRVLRKVGETGVVRSRFYGKGYIDVRTGGGPIDGPERPAFYDLTLSREK
jgi:hypothetical protein